jgi:hypothetical protein
MKDYSSMSVPETVLIVVPSVTVMLEKEVVSFPVPDTVRITLSPAFPVDKYPRGRVAS